jgi:hypothetical protein
MEQGTSAALAGGPATPERNERARIEVTQSCSMTARRILTVAVVALWAAALPIGAYGAPSSWYKTESQMEQAIVKKLKVPCNVVRPAKECNLAAALKEKAAEQPCANGDINACGNYIGSNGIRDPDVNLDHVRNGFRVHRATCVGSGAPDATGYRFVRFRCKLVIYDQGYFKMDRITVTGRIFITITGPKPSYRYVVIG